MHHICLSSTGTWRAALLSARIPANLEPSTAALVVVSVGARFAITTDAERACNTGRPTLAAPLRLGPVRAAQVGMLHAVSHLPCRYCVDDQLFLVAAQDQNTLSRPLHPIPSAGPAPEALRLVAGVEARGRGPCSVRGDDRGNAMNLRCCQLGSTVSCTLRASAANLETDIHSLRPLVPHVTVRSPGTGAALVP